jgi:hypothetical protein
MATTLYILIIKCRLTEIILKGIWKIETDCINTRQQIDDDEAGYNGENECHFHILHIYIPVQSPGRPWTRLNTTATFPKLPPDFYPCDTMLI